MFFGVHQLCDEILRHFEAFVVTDKTTKSYQLYHRIDRLAEAIKVSNYQLPHYFLDQTVVLDGRTHMTPDSHPPPIPIISPSPEVII